MRGSLLAPGALFRLGLQVDLVRPWYPYLGQHRHVPEGLGQGARLCSLHSARHHAQHQPGGVLLVRILQVCVQAEVETGDAKEDGFFVS